MKKMMKLSAVLSALLFLAACGAAPKEEAGDLDSKKKSLERLRQEQIKLADSIRRLEEEIVKLDPSAGIKPKLVSITDLGKRNFEHYLDLQGKITTNNIYYVTPRGMGGQVKKIFVKEGDHVRKGQQVLKLEDAVMLQNLQQLETQLSFAKNIYERQKNLWDQGIGTEVQYLTTKNNVENLERQIAVLKEQWSTTNVYAEVSGVVEAVNIRVGEVFTGSPTQGITIVNPGDAMKATVDIPENYLARVREGTPVIVEIPDLDKSFKSSISRISQLISATSRGFTAEAKIPSDPKLKPNLLATVRIRDYAVSDVIVIPLTSIQTDENGKYVFVMVDENGKKIARKKPVITGEVYGEQIEIRGGLEIGNQLISQGYQSLYDGQQVTTEI